MTLMELIEEYVEAEIEYQVNWEHMGDKRVMEARNDLEKAFAPLQALIDALEARKERE